MATLYSPTLGLLIRVRASFARASCGWITGHVPDDADGFGYSRCLLCGTWVVG